MRDRQTCVGCGKKSPETETNYTLISAQFGWRLTRYKNPDGSLVIEWRCPTCWREYKRSRNAAPSDPNLISSLGKPPSSSPAMRTPLPRPMTPFESFRPRAPSNPGQGAGPGDGRRSAPPPPPTAPPQAQKRPTVPPRPATPSRPAPPPAPPRPASGSVPPPAPGRRPAR